MASIYKLKNPIFITVHHGGAMREEIISYVTCRSLPAGVVQDNLTPTAAAYRFCDRIELNGCDPVELACELAELDIDQGVRDAYRAARERALAFLKAAAVRDGESDVA